MHISPPKYLNFAAGTGPMLIVISLLQKCLKNLPILITNYISFEKCIILNLEFLPELTGESTAWSTYY
jgi:hypothetical protein